MDYMRVCHGSPSHCNGFEQERSSLVGRCGRGLLPSPQRGIVLALGEHGAGLGVGGDNLQHDAAIRAEDLAPGLHILRQLLVAANSAFDTTQQSQL